MRFALTHPMTGHPYDRQIGSGAGVGAIAAAAESAGFDGFGFTDHPAPTQRWLDRGGHDSLDPFVAMGFAAARTTHLRMIPNIVVLPYRNPFVVAKAGATLDRLSDGRFTLAVGAGYLKAEFAALGVAHDRRSELFDEALDVITAIWTSDDVTYEGGNFDARGITAHPRPVSSPAPPIWIGGNGGRARDRVAGRAQGWCPFPAPAVLAQTAGTAPLDTLQRLRDAIDDLHRRCDVLGRDWSDLDISFTNLRGGSPGNADFDADECRCGIDELASIGVTWVQVPIPGDGLAHALETIAQFGEDVIGSPN